MKGFPTDFALTTLFRRQHGAILRTRALERGLFSSPIAHRINTGIWIQICPGVYRLATHREDALLRRSTALLHGGPGAYLSHFTVAELLEMTKPTMRRTIWITVHRRRQPTKFPGVRITRTAIMPEIREQPSKVVAMLRDVVNQRRRGSL